MKLHRKQSSPSGLGARHWLMRHAVLLGTAAIILMTAVALLSGADGDGTTTVQPEVFFVNQNGQPAIFWNKASNRGGLSQAASRASGLDGPQKAVAQPSGVWTQLPPQDFSYNRLNDVAMYGNNWAAIVGDGGAIYRTVDGGATWTLETTPVTTNLLSIVTQEPDFQTAVGEAGTILFYERPDYQWVQHVSPLGVNWNSVVYTVRSPGIAFKIVVGDGGYALFNDYNTSSWSNFDSGTLENLNSVFGNPYDQLFFAVGDNGTIVRSQQAFPPGDGFASVNSGVTANLRGVMTWGQMAIAVGDGGTILRTEDSGATWVQQTSGTTNNLNAVFMFSPPDAIVVGDNGTILRTRNAGLTWDVEQSNTTENLLSVAFLNDFANGFAVGENGTVLQTKAVINPNLAVSAFTGPSSARQGDDIADGITLIVTNNGTADTWACREAMLYYVDGNGTRTKLPNAEIQPASSECNGLMQAGASVLIPISSAAIPLDATTGAGTIEVVLDPYDMIPELDENDNTATFSIVIDPAELVYVYYEDFQEGEAGWQPVDMNEIPAESYWNQTTYNDGVQDRGVMWCGDNNPSWVTPPGYGNNWDQRIQKEFALPSGPVVIDYEVQYDTEAGYDVVYLDISNDGGDNYANLWTVDGNSGGFVQLQADLSSYAGQTVILQWRFTSDGGWSDEDGIYPTDGACRLDWVQVSGFAVDDFEIDDCGWAPPVDNQYASPGTYRLEEIPACSEDAPCDEACFSWVAYDPVSGVFPFAYDPINPSLRAPIEIGIESPVIDIPDDGVAYQLEFDVHANLPVENLIFYTWEIASPAPEFGGTWESGPYVYPGTAGQGFITRTFNLDDYMAEGATTLKIRLTALDMAWTWAGTYGDGLTHTESPIFDNIRVIAVNSAAAGIDTTQYPRSCPGAPPADSDGDAVVDANDLCPQDNAAPFDSNGDGCVDEGAGGRHVEYWDRPAFPITYYINELGAPDISDGSDFAALQNAMNAWTGLPGLETAVVYGGTTTQADADAMDMVNLITFEDPDFDFGPGTLGVGITTSFTEATEIDGVIYRPGQIVDSDIIFNKGKTFRTVSDGDPDGVYIEAVATHEAGHVFGLSHSAVKSSTMFYVLGTGLGSASLEEEDRLALMKAYGDDAYMTSASRLSGVVTDGYSGDPIAGAAVFAISATNHDTLGSEFTLPEDGSYVFVGLPDDDYYVAIHPLNGSSAISMLMPAYINDLIGATAQTVFVPEYWDIGESKNDDPAAMDVVTVSTTGGEAIANFVTNVDETGPVVVHTVPDSNITDASIGGSVLVSLSEAVNINTLQGNFSLTNASTGEFVAGNAAFLNDDSVIAFVPSVGMAFSTQYKLKLDTGLQDEYANGLAQPFVMYFTTEEQPDVALLSLAPTKGVPGTIVSMNGIGFDSDPQNNIVTFNGVEAEVSSATPTQLVVTVPLEVTSGVVHVYNQAQGQMSNDLSFTILTSEEIPKGFESGVTDLTVTPKALTVLPDGSYAYMATDEGVKAVVVDPSLPDYLSTESIFISGGLTDIDAAPAGNRVYAVSRATNKLYRINTTPGAIGILSEKDIGAEPRGVYIEPSGRRAFIPTYDGEIQLWDINEASPSFGSQIGRITSPDPNIRGKLATDPAGEKLLAPTGTGKLLVFDLATQTMETEIRVGPDPRDVVVDPAGKRAYVCDETGLVSIVSLENAVKLQDIKTGGTLRALTITPAGLFVHVVNRELNLIDAIDLREGASTYRSVAATIPLPVNPVDIELSPDGDYAYTISEAEQRLVVTTVGLGPSLATASRRTGPAGTGLVLAGNEYSAYSVEAVLFGEASAAPTWVTDTSLFVIVPADATSGPVRVVGTAADGKAASSNALYFTLLGPTEVDALRLAASEPSSPVPSIDGGSVLAGSPSGNFLVVGDRIGGVHLFDTDPQSKNYHTYIGSSVLGEEANDIVMTPDGGYAIVVLPESKTVQVLNVNPLSQEYMTVVSIGDFAAFGQSIIANAALSPDGSQLLISDPGLLQVHVLGLTGEEGHDLTGEEGHDLTVDTSINLASGDINGIVREMAYHPGGRYAYLPVHDEDPATILVLDTDPASAGYLTVVGSVAMPGTAPQEMPISLSFTPDGSSCLVLTTQTVAAPDRSVVMLDCSNPASPAVVTTVALGGTAPFAAEHIVVSPRGDRAVVNVQGEGLFNLFVGTTPESLSVIQQAGDPVQHQTTAGIVYASDASKFYCLSESSDELLVYDFSTVQSIAIKAGNNQAGVINEPLPQALEVEVSGSGDGVTAGIPVTFEVTAGGGHFAGTNAITQVVETNDEGVASVSFVLGPEVGAGAHVVTVTAEGLSGSPLTFTAEGLVDPNTLPLAVTYLVPQNGSENVSVPTAVQATFSRSVNPQSVDETTFFIHAEGDSSPVPSTIGFADNNRKVSLSPRVVLAPSTIYSIEITTGIFADGGGALAQAVTSSFITQAPPPVVLESISPVSGTEGAKVVLSGAGFSADCSQNQVLFGDIPATVRACGKDYLAVVVPFGAQSCLVTAVNNATQDVSNALKFTVLAPLQTSSDEVVATIGTSSATRSVAVTPDGARAYAVAPYTNAVIPIDLRYYKTLRSIPVGENPVAVAISPEGQYAYVANYLEGTVSIIDVAYGSTDYNQVVDAMAVGVAPSDLAIMPDGDRLVVVNAGSNDLSIVDTDLSSETSHSVIGTIATGTGSRTVSITPDGGLIYLGTETGYLVLSASSYSVVASIGTGSATRSVSISPDGAFLILLTTEGVVNIYDIQENSASKDQVIASIGTGSSTRTVGISPDGGLLYLVQEDEDIILLVSLSVSTAMGVQEDEYNLPTTHLEYEFVDTLTAGEDPACIAFDPTGSGKFIVTNSGDNTISFFGEFASLAGYITANCPEAGTPLQGVVVDAFEQGSGDLIQSMVTDETGYYFGNLREGDYTATLVVPFGYTIAREESLVTCTAGDTTVIDFDLTCETVIPDQRKMSYWKHQLGLILADEGNPDMDAETLCGYLDLIEAHFNNNRINPVVVYQPPASGECMDKLQVAKDLLNLDGDTDELAQAKKELMAMLFNVSSQKLPLSLIISEDGRNVSKAITYVDNLIDGGNVNDAKIARSIAKDINKGKMIKAGVIPGDLPDIAYEKKRPHRFYLAQNYPNPFNPSTTIEYEVPQAAHVRLAIYDVAGRLVRMLVDEEKRAERYVATWDGRDRNDQPVASGVYFYRLKAGEQVKTRKMVLLK